MASEEEDAARAGDSAARAVVGSHRRLRGAAVDCCCNAEVAAVVGIPALHDVHPGPGAVEAAGNWPQHWTAAARAGRNTR